MNAGIGHPYQAAEGVWRCPARLAGLYDRLGDIAGDDSLQALCMAVSLLRRLLSDVIEHGGQVLDRSDRSEYPLDAVFGCVGREDR